MILTVNTEDTIRQLEMLSLNCYHSLNVRLLTVSEISSIGLGLGPRAVLKDQLSVLLDLNIDGLIL